MLAVLPVPRAARLPIFKYNVVPRSRLAGGVISARV